MAYLSLLTLVGCGPSAPPPVADEQATWISLLEVEPDELEIPADSRGGVAPPATIALAGPWKYDGKNKAGVHRWTTPIPVRPRGLFFGDAEPGMTLSTREGKRLGYGRQPRDQDEVWSHTKEVIVLARKADGPPPSAGDYVFAYPKAVQREASLNLAFQPEGTQPWDFVRAEVHHDWNTRTGLLLPAPASATWDVQIPLSGELLMAPGLNEPELLDGPASDGGTLVVRVEVDGASAEAARIALRPGAFEQTKVDLSAWGGKKARLTLAVEPGATADFDYAFVGDPILSSRKANPRRVFMVFIDTLRADHLGMYGYERETSLKLDRWAEDAAIFENARSVAPWTLPSGRTLVTGRHPEYYHSAETVQKTLRREGFVSAMIAGNVYLSNNFEMARDWGWHSVGMFPRAGTVVDDALAWFAATEGHDAIVQVHLMDPHLPYLEPKAYRKLFAGDPVGGLGEEFYLPDVRRARSNEKVRGYVMDRYDNNVRYATDEVVRLLGHADDNDVILIYADHGEEFWDHGGFEHGHQLYDELLHVPLIVKAPGVTGRRIAEPASLLDVTPTILDALGIADDAKRDGISLLPAARGESAQPLADRSLAFGRPLYGAERWGVLTEHEGTWRKWTTHEGRQELYEVSSDPTEQRDLLRGKEPSAGAPYHEALGEALHTRAGIAYRLHVGHTRAPTGKDLEARMEVPGGVAHYWVEHDPVGKSLAEARLEVVEDPDGGEPTHTVVARWPGGSRAAGTVWVVPERPMEEVTHGIRVRAVVDGLSDVLSADPGRPATWDQNQTWLSIRTLGGRSVRFGFGIAPVPPEGAKGVVAVDDEMSEELAAIGYQHDDEEPEPDQKP